jgi:superfamily II DNA or RNA helicase/HKD family nuclease
MAALLYTGPMSHAPRGLYEVLLTEALEARLRDLGENLAPKTSDLRQAEAADRIALHLARVIERVIGELPEKERVVTGIALARRLIDLLGESAPTGDLSPDRPVDPGTVLAAVLGYLPDGQAESIPEPLIPLLDTTVLTNAPGEPRVGSQVLAEIGSADRIDLVMAFIRRSGIAPLKEALRAHCEAGRELRVLTTTYTGSTEARALEDLLKLGAKVHVSYDTSGTRLHAKAWLFHRNSGYSTAYIGSSNLTYSAQVSGLEWNVRVSGARNPDVINKVAAVFESYWNSGDFVPFDADEFCRQMEAMKGSEPFPKLSPIELRAEPFQERLLEQIALSRTQGYHRNLLVSATGTGKTVMAAIDYVRLRDTLPRARLLFVAHRQEILEQSQATFRHALHDPSFGELWVGEHRPKTFSHVFASIQSLRATGRQHLDPTHFDVVIVDEFHHAAADSYSALLDHVQPRELLGLTATPERSDGLPILKWFDGRIAAELRLWDAIDQHRLVPFAYYGIHDGLDLRKIPWRRGHGYDIDGLSRLFTGDDAWARFVLRQLTVHVDDPQRMRALGFCVSVDHARFMARVFAAAGVRAVAIWSDTPDAERRAALTDLADRRINAVFSVDLFNEGVDVPTVDTLLLLRPTDSPTLFLQQLGRGLRLSHGKAVCTVLDFVGLHRTEFRFDRRFRALLGGSRSDLDRQIKAGFPFLPAGCHMELDRKARDIVLANIQSAVPSGWTAKVEELRQLARAEGNVGLATYAEATGLELEDIYAGNRSWSDLCEDAGLAVLPRGPEEATLRRACGRLLHIDDRPRLDTYTQLLSQDTAPNAGKYSARDRRYLRMLIAPLVDKAVAKSASLEEGCSLLWAHPQVRAELRELLTVLRDRITHIPRDLKTHPEVPLQVHGRYTRIEILAAFGIGDGAKVAPWQTGVYWAKEAHADLLAFTLDKTSGQFSPTTRYRDYAISRDLIHWESQSVTRADSETGRRYQEHLRRGSQVFLFARLRSDDRSFYFLGPATYMKHEGELPMAVTWRLQHSLPGDLFTAFAAAVA